MGKITKQEFADGLVTEFNDKVGSAKLTTELDKKANFSHSHSISNITGLQTEIDNLKSSVSSGKNAIAAAVTGKEVPASGSESFTSLAGKISSIELGYRPGDVVLPEKVEPIFGGVKIVTEDWTSTETSSNTTYGGFHLDTEDSYFGHFNGLHSLSPQTGDVVWKYAETANRAIGSGDYVFFQGSVLRRANNDGSGILAYPSLGAGTSLSLGEIVLDSAGNILTAAGATAQSTSSTYGRVYKYNRTGGVVWSKADLGPGYNSVGDITLEVDEDDAVYVGTKDMKVRKYTSSGTLAWTYPFPEDAPTQRDAGIRGIKSDKAGNIYVATFSGVTKMTKSGSVVWKYTEAEVVSLNFAVKDCIYLTAKKTTYAQSRNVQIKPDGTLMKEGLTTGHKFSLMKNVEVSYDNSSKQKKNRIIHDIQGYKIKP